MRRTIKVQVDASPPDAGPFGIFVHLQDAIEGYDTSPREGIYQLILEAVERACGSVLESKYDTERALFGIWTTTFVIPAEAHTDDSYRRLHNNLSKIYAANQYKLQGFRIVWEGDRQNSMVEDVRVSMDRFGSASANLNMDQFAHLDESNEAESQDQSAIIELPSIDNKDCEVCGLPITSIDYYYGRVIETTEGTIHSHCDALRNGNVPECPLYDNVQPTPCSRDCLQAIICPQTSECSCRCDNVDCEIGQSVRALRSKGLIPWSGYVPKSLRAPLLQQARLDAHAAGKGSIHNDVEWTKVLDYLRDLGSHGICDVDSVVAHLVECGLDAEALPCRIGIRIRSEIVEVVEPDFGREGIWSLTLLYTTYEVATGTNYVSPYSGRGYQYRDLLERFAEFVENV